MKRLIALLVGIAVLMSMSLTSFAAFTDVIPVNEDGITYTAALSSDAATANADKQTTIVAYKGDTIEVGSIQYIDQAAATSFTFQLKDALTEDVKVVMGGEAIDKQEIGTIVYETTEPTPTPVTTYTVGGTIRGYYPDTAELPTIEITDGTNTYYGEIVDGTWSVEGVEAGTYSVYASKAYHTWHSIAALEVAEDVTDIALYTYVGDVDASDFVDADDMGFLFENWEVESDADNWDDISYMDLDESEFIDADDLGWIFEYFEFESIEE